MSKSYERQWVYKGAIIRQREESFQVEINFRGKRMRETRATLAEARTWAEQKQTELRNEGISSLSLSAGDRNDAAKAKKLLPQGTSLEQAVRDYAAAVNRLETASLGDAVDFYLRHHRPVGGVRTVTDLLKEYLVAKEKLGRRSATIKDIEQRVNRFAESFIDRHVHTITAAEIDAWLDKEQHSGQTRLNYMTVLCGFFSYARRLGLIESNPADRGHLERPRMDEHLPEIFSVASVDKLLTVTSKTAPRLVPYLVTGFFAGLRTSELNGLEWSCIDLDQRLITVRPEIAKKRRQRHVDISDNLLAWLQPFRMSAGHLRPKNARNDLDDAIKVAGVTWVHNGMRHTFASCYLAKYNDIAKTCVQLGHTGNPSMLFNHYRNLVKPADADAYWKIVPPMQQKGTVLLSDKPT